MWSLVCAPFTSHAIYPPEACQLSLFLTAEQGCVVWTGAQCTCQLWVTMNNGAKNSHVQGFARTHDVISLGYLACKCMCDTGVYKKDVDAHLDDRGLFLTRTWPWLPAPRALGPQKQ